MAKHTSLRPLADRGPLRVLFALTSMPIGGAETLLLNLVRRLDRRRIRPEICCLKQPGVLGEILAGEVPVHAQLLNHKFDVRVLPRFVALLRSRRVDALVTVGAGDKMFWGRLAARWANLPVVLSALHSTGWPDSVGRLNRLLTPWTDGFIAVAHSHGRYLNEHDGFPAAKVRVIPNGVDVQRFRPLPGEGRKVRASLGIPADAPVCGIVAALRPEKNLDLFLRTARQVFSRQPACHFLIVGDGPARERLERRVASAPFGTQVHFAGARHDIPRMLAAMDVFALTSHIEANPVSILEAMACERVVVATDVGSVAETLQHAKTGFLAEPDSAEAAARYWQQLVEDRPLAQRMGVLARQQVVAHSSLDQMVAGYQQLIEEIYQRKCPQRSDNRGSPLPLAGSTR